MDYCLLYIGYLIGYHFKDPVLLCVSEDKEAVKYYLKKVRGLNKDLYDIRSTLHRLSCPDDYLYEDYYLEECPDSKYEYLTVRDIQAINDEVNCTINYVDKLYTDYSNFVDLMYKSNLSYGKPNNEKCDIFMKSQENFKKEITSMKGLRRICNTSLKDSPIFSKDILVYLKHMGYIQEEKEMTELFYRKVFDEDE